MRRSSAIFARAFSIIFLASMSLQPVSATGQPIPDNGSGAKTPAPCQLSLQNEDAAQPVSKTEKARNRKNASDSLLTGCVLTQRDLDYLANETPTNLADALTWYRLLVGIAEPQSARIETQNDLLDQFLVRMDEMISTTQNLRDQKNMWQLKLSALEADREKTMLANKVLTEKLGGLQEEIGIVKNMNAVRRQELEKINQRFKAAKATLKSDTVEQQKKRQRIRALKDGIAALEKELGIQNRKNADEKKQGVVLKKKIAGLKSELDSRSQALASNQKKIEDLKQTISRQQKNMAGLVDERERLSQAVKSDERKLQQQKDLLQKTRETAAEKQRSYQASLTKADQSEQKLKGRIRDLNAVISGQTNDIKEFQAARQTATEQIVALKKMNDDLSAGLNEKDIASSHLRETLLQVKKVRSALQKGLDEMNVALASSGKKNKRLTQEMAGLSTSVAQDAARIKLLRDQVAALDLDKSALADRVAGLLRENASHREDLKSKTRAMDLLEQLIQEKRAEIKSLKTGLAEGKKNKNPLSPYKNQFITDLWKSLQGHEGFSASGDKFFVQAEILFKSGSADISKGAKRQIQQIADVISNMAKVIPPEIEWVAQINGHTDIRKMRPGSEFADNWELSSARALAVVRLLVADGAPADHLVAAGFGEFHPITKGTSPADFARNRRIELMLAN